jgi:hypothetical protein
LQTHALWQETLQITARITERPATAFRIENEGDIEGLSQWLQSLRAKI